MIGFAVSLKGKYFRVNITMETEIANWMVHEYTSAVWQLQHAVDPAQSGRVKRNILGDFIGGVTGLVTHEQFAVDHKELKETEGRVEKILNHQINIEKLMEEMSHDMATKAGVIARLQELRIRMERNAVYQTKKVTCRRGGRGTIYAKKREHRKKRRHCFAHLALINRLVSCFDCIFTLLIYNSVYNTVWYILHCVKWVG